MIQFECYPQSITNIYLKVFTDHTEEGTLYRLATAIFLLELDIYSGEINTIERNGKLFTEDTFILRKSSKNPVLEFNDFNNRLGYLMEILLNKKEKPEEILKKNSKREIPTLKEIFESGFEYIIDEIPEKKQIYFYFETSDRPGLLLNITKFLYENNFNISQARIETTANHIAKDVFYLDYKTQNDKEALKRAIQTFIEKNQ